MEKRILDWEKYKKCARQTVAEGVVLLKNDNQALPYEKGSKVAVFGRIQNNYYKSGTGSGGMVNVTKVTGIVDGLRESGAVEINETLCDVYKEWEMVHPFDPGLGWGTEPWSQEEMEVTEELAQRIAREADHALVIIGRTAGEDHDNEDRKGAYRLNDTEEVMLANVRKAFPKMTVLLNVGNIIDMTFVDTYRPDAVLYVWQGGMYGGLGVADVLTGKISPSGKLSDTIAYAIEDYPSDGNFGNADFDYYVEDIYVGYRYFETAAKDKVRYPFGFGLSYTTFSMETVKDTFDQKETQVSFSVKVTNTGKCTGKEVVQIYVEAPQGKLGKASRSLVSFQKTRELKSQESQVLDFVIPLRHMASYDDSGVTGHKSAMVLEEGTYGIYVGENVRSAEQAETFQLENCVVLEQLEEALAPIHEFKRMKPGKTENGYEMQWESAPLRTVNMKERRIANRPETYEPKETGGEVIRLRDVLDQKAAMTEFIAQLTEEDLSCIIRGEGMGSAKVTPGTAAAFGGVSDRLQNTFGIPCGCCTDGPSGMRLDTGANAFSLPNGTLIACTFNTELSEELFSYTGIEMIKNKIEVLLGPGMNIHRHPLNGRNFEYFSEDPYLTGALATAQLKGLASAGVTGSMKHFCGNNQETHRHDVDSTVSERALREIYMKGFEMAVKSGVGTVIMTTYGAVNGLWTAGNYDLVTTILRNQWGFDGIVMTDWWAKINEECNTSASGVTSADKTNFAAMAAAQNDIYMVCPNGAENTVGDNTLEALKAGTLTRGDLQRCAMNICKFVMNSHAMKRAMGEELEVEVINQPAEEIVQQDTEIETFEVEDTITIPLQDVTVKKDTFYTFGMNFTHGGSYMISMTGKSEVSELAQLPVSFVSGGTPFAMFTWNGTGGKWVTIENQVNIDANIHIYKLSFRQNGLDLKEITFRR
ncbi:MAG: glycoside hydrolase family 3 C-terminal domain-containing protein, partial [Lachnospiraceae bacterium]|nr:glycoside hydrolase family 3 C-terminal domain-containing protein [Lachnospiraceae bacterium]